MSVINTKNNVCGFALLVLEETGAKIKTGLGSAFVPVLHIFSVITNRATNSLRGDS